MTAVASATDVRARETLPLGVPRTWRMDVGSLELDRSEMLRYLGHHGQDIDPALAARIDAAADEAVATAAPAGAWSVFPIEMTPRNPVSEGQMTPKNRVSGSHIVLGGTALELTGRDIYRHLKDARYAAVLTVTLGMRAERRLRVLSTQNPLEGTVFDAACSALVESAADALDREIEDAAETVGLSCNWRFSPGYGDLPLDVQPTVLAALNATRLCGITATPTNLLMPTKSITAFIGLFEGAPRAADTVRSCAGCRVAAGCSFRARGTHCWQDA